MQSATLVCSVLLVTGTCTFYKHLSLWQSVTHIVQVLSELFCFQVMTQSTLMSEIVSFSTGRNTGVT